MPGANTGFECGVLFGRFPGRMAQLHSPEDKNGGPRFEYPWALDNGVFGAWAEGKEWQPDPLYRFLEKYSWTRPQWVVVPDWVADREETLRRWDEHAPALQAFGVPLAFVVQDGMTVDDVPPEAAVVFVGGLDAFKWRTLRVWCENFPRVHVGRVNTYETLWQAHEAGAESCDGTGWFRDAARRDKLPSLVRYLEESENGGRPQTEFKL